MKADEALQKLVDGNLRYVQATADGVNLENSVKCHNVLLEQKPFAIILGCSDSRVPAEIVFDQGVGDLFVVRVAGNIATPSQIGSIEFACQKFGSQLVVVLGHSRCGAVSATVDLLASDQSGISENLAAIVEQVKPAALKVVAENKSASKEELMRKATKANVEQSINQLKQNSDILRGLIESEQLTIVGAEYAIETGSVTFY